MNLSILYSQLYLCSTSLNLHTFVDLVLFNEDTKETIIVEVKRGCHYRTCSTPNGFMQYQPSPISDCMQHQHEIQALLAKLLYDYQYNTQSNVCYCTSMKKNVTLLWNKISKHVLMMKLFLRSSNYHHEKENQEAKKKKEHGGNTIIYFI